MSKFAGITEVDAQRSGNFAKPGGYLFEAQKLAYFKGFRGPTFVAELKILESLKTEANDPDPVGKTISYLETISGEYAKSAGGRAKAFLADLTGSPDSEISDEVMEALTGDAQEAKYLQIRGTAFPKAKKGKQGSADPKDYVTAWRWEHVEPTDEQLGQILARRKSDKAA